MDLGTPAKEHGTRHRHVATCSSRHEPLARAFELPRRPAGGRKIGLAPSPPGREFGDIPAGVGQRRFPRRGEATQEVPAGSGCGSETAPWNGRAVRRWTKPMRPGGALARSTVRRQERGLPAEQIARHVRRPRRDLRGRIQYRIPSKPELYPPGRPPRLERLVRGRAPTTDPSCIGGRRADVGQGGFGLSFDRQVTERDDADWSPLLDDGQAEQRALAHELHHIFHRRVSVYRGEVAAADPSRPIVASPLALTDELRLRCIVECHQTTSNVLPMTSRSSMAACA